MKRLFAAGLTSLLLTWTAAAMTTWSGGYTNVTTATITYSQHGIASQYIGVQAQTSGGTLLPLSDISGTINPTTYEVDLTITNNFTGTVTLTGPYPSTDTTASTDFETDVLVGNHHVLNVCNSCTQSAPARRTASGFDPVAATHSWTFGLNSSWSAPTLYIYLNGNMMTFGIDASSCPANSYALTGNATVACNVTSMPSGVIPLASVAVSGYTFGTVTDLRPW